MGRDHQHEIIAVGHLIGMQRLTQGPMVFREAAMQDNMPDAARGITLMVALIVGDAIADQIV